MSGIARAWLLAGALVGAAWTVEAAARPGGGQSFDRRPPPREEPSRSGDEPHTDSSSTRGSSGRPGSSTVSEDLIGIGIAAGLIAAAVLILSIRDRARQAWCSRVDDAAWAGSPWPGPAPPGRAKSDDGVPELAELVSRALSEPVPTTVTPQRGLGEDFSLPIFEDFAYELYAAAQAARGNADTLSSLAPWLDVQVRDRLASRRGRAVKAVQEVVVGSSTIEAIEPGEHSTVIRVLFESCYCEVDAGGSSRRFWARERWVLSRANGARNVALDRLRTVSCPGCGAPVPSASRERCASCGTAWADAELDWRCVSIAVLREELRGPAVGSYAVERGTTSPSRRDPLVVATMARMVELDPQHDQAKLIARIALIHGELARAWSELSWNDARPFCTDRCWRSMGYWIETYREQGLRNLVKDAQISSTEMVKASIDAHYWCVTVRLFASSIDITVHDGTGRLVGGDPVKPREYSEYWTLIRSAQRSGPARADKMCPGCGAPLSIGMSGECGHCGATVTGGEFDWVLSKIEQDEAYAG